MCLSPSAVSNQIRALEGYLATALFRREGNRVELTTTGRDYAGRLCRLLDDLDADTRALKISSDVEKLRVLSTPGFAARWLVPRLGRLAQPDAIRLRIAESAPSTDFASNDADVVIKWRDDAEDGVDVVPLLFSARHPVAAPALLDKAGISHPRDLLKLTLFRDEVDDQWNEWFRAAGVVGKMPEGAPRFPNWEYASTAAEAGLGVSLAYDVVVARTVAEGRLIRLFETKTLPFTIYAIACRADRVHEPLISKIRKWLLDETRFQAATPPELRVSAE